MISKFANCTCFFIIRHFYQNGPDQFLICIFDTKYAHRMQVMSPLSEISTDYETYALMLGWITYFFYKQLQKFLWNQTLTLILYRRCFIQFQMLFTCSSCLLKTILFLIKLMAGNNSRSPIVDRTNIALDQFDYNKHFGSNFEMNCGS